MKLIKQTEYIKLYQVSEKAYGAISNHPLTMSNAGFIDLSDKVIIFDTFLSLDASKELKLLVEEFTNAKRYYVINSHSHLDHFLGNSVYEGETIITSKKAYELMRQSINHFQFGERLQKDIDALKLKLKDVKDLEEKNELDNSLIVVSNLRNEENKMVLPNLIISGDMSIIGYNGTFDIKIIDKAHSAGDIIGFLKDDKIAYVGDLIFCQEHPYFGVGDPIALIKELENLYQQEIEYFIPGHGEICGKDEIITQIEYINNLMEIVKNNLDNPDKITIYDMKKKFHHMKSTTFRWNINFLVDYYNKQKS